jgi:enoyl-CoA hydratase/carnithine racemase
MLNKMIGTGTLKLSISGEVAEIVMNRPEVLNASNCEWMDDFHLALDEVEAAHGLRVAVVSGLGSSFSTGIDLNALARQDIKIDWFRSWERAMHRLELLGVTTIARLHGYAIGGGLQIALACDLRVASDDCKVGLPAVLEALIPGMGTFRLPRYIGLGRAKRMVLTGEMISGRRAEEMGLVDWAVPEAELDSMTKTVIEIILKGSKTAQSFSKWLTFGAFEKDTLSAMEDYLDYQAKTIASEEHRRAMDDYLKSKGLGR